MVPHQQSQDQEGGLSSTSHLYNHAISTFAWKDVTVTAKDAQGSQTILNKCTGIARAGELLALMGPSGSGKTTLLNFLAYRLAGSKLQTSGQRLVDGTEPTLSELRSISSYVEQEDALIGSLTARETVDFSARLARVSSAKARRQLVDNLLSRFGLTERQHVLVGTPLRKGLSGGQKRRVSVAAQLVTGPRLLWLDEPTSGLDSTASHEVMSFIKDIAREFQLIVICSIHQPSTATFNLFDHLCLLAQGQTAYFGPVDGVKDYFDSIGFPLPKYSNPAEFLLDMVNVDFSGRKTDNRDAEKDGALVVRTAWNRSPASRACAAAVDAQLAHARLISASTLSGSSPLTVLTLLHRSFIKSYRDVVVYGVRVVMYLGLAIMMGTVWLRLDSHQDSIQPFINALFFGGAFLSFMAVAYVPAYLEDYAVFRKDRANGLYGPTSFMISNFLIGVPYLFLIVVLFSIISYWLSGFRSDASAFFTWIGWLFLDLLAAESLVVLFSSLFPIFVIALALVAFANGLWMSVGGFLVPMPQLNVFWKYVFHYIDYQAYVFQGMMVNEFKNRYNLRVRRWLPVLLPNWRPDMPDPGTSVLKRYSYPTNRQGEWVGILVSIIIVYRLLGWVVLWAKRS